MPIPSKEQWLSAARVDGLIYPEVVLLLSALVVVSWLAYKLLLRQASDDRHRTLRGLFQNVAAYLIFAVVVLPVYSAVQRWGDGLPLLVRLLPYLGLLLLWSLAVAFIKAVRIITFIFLFRSHMSVGVPLLIVNLLTLLISLIVGLALSSAVFGFDLQPLLAPSAILSIVLGLALQDTLGNLIAGVAMQLEADKPYEIGDWIEIVYNSQRWVGQVQEITWRATVMLAMTDELITLPNRVCSQAQVGNFSAKNRPFMRSHLFRIRYGTPPEQVKEALVGAIQPLADICAFPMPLALITESTDSWLGFKLVYFITDYGNHLLVQDQVICAALDALTAAGISLAPPRLELLPSSLQQTS